MDSMFSFKIATATFADAIARIAATNIPSRVKIEIACPTRATLSAQWLQTTASLSPNGHCALRTRSIATELKMSLSRANSTQ